MLVSLKIFEKITFLTILIFEVKGVISRAATYCYNWLY